MYLRLVLRELFDLIDPPGRQEQLISATDALGAHGAATTETTVGPRGHQEAAGQAASVATVVRLHCQLASCPPVLV